MYQLLTNYLEFKGLLERYLKINFFVSKNRYKCSNVNREYVSYTKFMMILDTKK